MTRDQFLVWVNFALAAYACFVNLREARTGFRQWQLLRLTIAALAGFYVVGYFVLAMGWVDRLAWSHFFIGVAPGAWLIVWCGPALRSRHVRKRWHG